MGTESETYCDNCRRIVGWDDDEHDGLSCPHCGISFLVEPPTESQMLVGGCAWVIIPALIGVLLAILDERLAMMG